MEPGSAVTVTVTPHVARRGCYDERKPAGILGLAALAGPWSGVAGRSTRDQSARAAVPSRSGARGAQRTVSVTPAPSGQAAGGVHRKQAAGGSRSLSRPRAAAAAAPGRTGTDAARDPTARYQYHLNM